MKKILPTVNIDRQINCKLGMYPDNQPYVNIVDSLTSESAPDGVQVITPLRNSLEVLNLQMACNALDNKKIKKAVLVIPYLMGARSDRVMNPGEPCGLEVIAGIINNLQFDDVNLFDVHSFRALDLIKHSRSHNNSLLVKAYTETNAVLLIPDKGATAKAQHYPIWNPGITDVVQCEKSRDLKDKGRVTLTVPDPEKCRNRHCVVIDDLCDGGGTFNIIADQLPPTLSLTLIVSHGVFSKGLGELCKRFDRIITSDSYQMAYEHPKVTTVQIFSKL